MKNIFRISEVILLIILIQSCKKEVDNVIKDIDGNVYNSITIGTQVWMVENLKVIHYRNGDPIINVTDNMAWSTLKTGAYCNYNNTPGNSTTYGKLYNFYTIANSQNICPTGWHVPTDAELTTLTTYLGGQSVAGGKLKENGTSNWQSPNTGATNETGFTALPGGFRYLNGISNSLGSEGDYWSSTLYGHSLIVYNSTSGVGRDLIDENTGLSVRCVKN